ncbi:diguanylate cyclase/phosphodiesterase with PAS/PAC sensor(S) [Candidatus Moduliflexus flocculans]|uniref:Diguanylate cyclase/phosphodiesterase with PAS/PAC sensor(S) n=1 Tax=Candidatus Moduliflexus flocculans TaxID=1499966 RepID=A0A081BP26_9BACT|nr:diguanylate cyclase/phosphodiesterase with PAS/PAC sensor(S) [Candidatus Moduliflexus flocculans]
MMITDAIALFGGWHVLSLSSTERVVSFLWVCALMLGLSIGGVFWIFRKMTYVEETITQSYKTFETRIEEQARHLAMFNAFFTQEVADHQRHKTEFELINNIFEHSLEGIMITDMTGAIVKLNPSYTQITGYAESECLGKNPRMLNSGIHDQVFFENLWDELRKHEHWEGEIWNRRKTGEAFPAWLKISAIHNERGEVSHYLGVFHDLTDLKHSQRQIAYQANYDALTGLPNRHLFRDHLEMALAQAQRHHHHVGVIFLDLDNFKTVNGTLGYAVGDVLLQEFAARLKRCCRAEDTIARLAGDEFMILLPEMKPHGHDAIEVAKRILQSFSSPFFIKGHQIMSSASIGMTIYPDDGYDVATLEKNADIARNRAKEQGRNTYMLYTRPMQDVLMERMALERDLYNALTQNELRVYYQPQLDMKTGKIVGAEALVRWQRQEELVSPDKFIPFAEESGLIVPLGEWVLRQACRQTKIWHEAGFHELSIAINLSAKQFQNDHLVKLVADVLLETGLPPHSLRLEITESTVMKDVSLAVEIMCSLRALGIRLSIDDFGTGYSSLNYLKCFPLDEIKIDKSFVKDIPERHDDVAIAQAIFSLAHSLNMKVLAEGIENEVQLEFMRRNDCDQIQGFLFSKPIKSEEMTSLLTDGKQLQFS